MDRKKKIIKKRRTSKTHLTTSDIIKEKKTNLEKLIVLQKTHLQLLEQLLLSHTQSFWETDCQIADEDTFKNNFRMSRRLFNKLCHLLPGLQKSDTRMREAIPLEKRVAIALYALGTSFEYRKVANMFGVGKTTVCKILLNFCEEVCKDLAPLYLDNFPLTKDKIKDLVKEFEVLGFPQCMGALGGCHIEIHPSADEAADYCNNKGWYSIVMLALVDASHRFIYVGCESPGSCNNSQVFYRSSLKQYLDQCSILTDLKRNITDVDVPVFIIGDSSFPLSDKLMKPYPFQVHQIDEQKRFNYALSKSRIVVENAFRDLKARFRRIGEGLFNALKNTNSVVTTCCILHNFLNENNDTVNQNWLQDLQIVEASRSYPEQNVPTDLSNNSEKIRQAISTYLSVEDAASDGETADVDGETADSDGETADVNDEEGPKEMDRGTNGGDIDVAEDAFDVEGWDMSD